MSLRRRAAFTVAAIALASFAMSCGDNPVHVLPILAGVVRLDARLVDPVWDSTGTRRMTTADGVRVWLLENGRRVDSTFTVDGAYAFAIEKGHAYQVFAGVPGTATDTTSELTVRDVGTNLDTLIVTRTGAFDGAPIPFSTQVSIQFDLPADGPVGIVILDLSLARVRLLVSRTLPAGTHRILWDGLDDAGRRAPDGVYWGVLSLPAESRAELLIREP